MKVLGGGEDADSDRPDPDEEDDSEVDHPRDAGVKIERECHQGEDGQGGQHIGDLERLDEVVILRLGHRKPLHEQQEEYHYREEEHPRADRALSAVGG